MSPWSFRRLVNGWSRTHGWRRYLLQTVVFVYAIIPVAVLVFPGIVSSFVFETWSGVFYFSDLKKPQDVGLKATRQIDLKLSTGETLGIWHILPESAVEEEMPIPASDYDARLGSGSPVFVYFHGNGRNRGQTSRVRTYSVLRGQGWHVITFDYRGFGDSDGVATEKHMVEDAVSVYRWVKRLSGTSPVYIWGHSLGSGVAVQAAKILSSQNEGPDAVVLEGAFNNLNDIVDAYPLTLPYRPLPFYLWIFHGALSRKEVYFKTDEHITELDCPILMLHSEDDFIVPVDLARKLFKAAVAAYKKDQPLISMHTFPAKYGYGHNHLNRAPDLGDIVRHFIQDAKKSKPVR